MAKSRITIPNEHYERFVVFLIANGKQTFTLELAVSLTEIPRNILGQFLLRNTERGFLKRTGSHGNGRNRGYQYNLIELPPRMREHKGLVAQSVWEIFAESGRPLRGIEVLEKLNTGKPREFLSPSVRSVISLLHRKGALIKQGYGRHVINPEFKQRPTITS